MKIVIDIPKGTYESFINECTGTTDILQAVRDGILLPEHHGKLIDADDLKHELIDKEWITDYDGDGLEYIINEAPTIIEKE